MASKKTLAVSQRYFGIAEIDALQTSLEERLSEPSDSELRLDLMIVFSLLKDCFRLGLIKKDEI